MTPGTWWAADPPERPVLFVNPRSGGGKAERADLAERARERGIDAIVLGPGDSLPTLIDQAVADGADALGVAGGDGSLAVVAAAALAHRLPFVCVPAGTRNHFALDIGIDRSDLIGSLDGFTEAVERRIDVAEVNGRLFLNNVSLGIYGDAVRQPTLVDDRGWAHRDPAVVLVSNNPYAFAPPHPPGTRSTLQSGKLGVVSLDRTPPGRAWTATTLEVTAPAVVHAGIDGEAVDLDPPLRFAVLPAALRVRIAARHAS